MSSEAILFPKCHFMFVSASTPLLQFFTVLCGLMLLRVLPFVMNAL